MPRSNGKGDVRAASNRGRGVASGASDNGVQHTGVHSQELPHSKEAFREALVRLMCRDDGYLRAIPDGEMKLTYLKWKFTSGPFIGHYVMAVVTPEEIEGGYILLLTKIIGSYAGSYNPSVDKPYSKD